MLGIRDLTFAKQKCLGAVSAVREQRENNLIMSVSLSWDKFPLKFGHKADELSGFLWGIFEAFSFLWFFFPD